MPWAEQPSSFASRALGLGRDFVRLNHPHGLWGTRRKREARFGLRLLEEVWPNICALPRAFMWYQQPSSQGKKTFASDYLLVPVADSGHTNINSSIPPLRCCIFLQHLHFTHPFSEPCCRYKLSLPARPSVCLAPTGLPVEPEKAISARGGHAGMTGSGSSVRRRFSSGGSQLRNSHCIMMRSCLKYPGGLRLPLFIPLTLTRTSFLPTSELTQCLPISCSSFTTGHPLPLAVMQVFLAGSPLSSSCFAWQGHRLATLSSPPSLLPLAGWREPGGNELGDSFFTLAEPAAIFLF